MKILLACLSGITTHILANKLNEYSASEGKDDVFLACKVQYYKEALNTSDAVIIAPQAKSFSQMIIEDCKQKQIPYYEIEEETFVLGKLDVIYEWIDSHRKTKKTVVETALTMKMVLEIVIQSLTYSLGLYALGLLLAGIDNLLGTNFLEPISSVLISLVGIFTMILIGYFYGDKTDGNVIQSALLTLFGPLVLLPVFSSELRYDEFFRIGYGTLSLKLFSLSYLHWLILLALCIIVLLEMMKRLLKGFTFAKSGGHNILFLGTYNFFVVVIVLGIRMILTIIL